jgi:hypothetical protein
MGMGGWHLVLIIGWAVVFWYSIAALIRPTERRSSEWLTYTGEILVLMSLFFAMYSFQQIIEHYYVWKAS